MISIIIIVKNDKRIAKLLHVLHEISFHKKTEILVVDASEGALSNIRGKFSYVQWIDFENKTKKKITIPEQRNVGIRHAKGDIIVFIDSDCKPDKNWLTEITTPIYNDDENMVAGSVIFSDKHSLHTHAQKVRMKADYVHEAPTMNFAVTKKVFNTIGFFDENFGCGEDVDFCWRANKAGFRIRTNTNAIIYHDLGNVFREMKRMYIYGKARVRLYAKHRDLREAFFKELTIIFYPLYFLLLPFLFFTIVFPGLLLYPILKYRKKNSLKTIVMKTVYGTGFLRELIVVK